MRAILLSLIAATALGQSRPLVTSATGGASLAGNNTWTALQTFSVGAGVTQGQKLCWDGATCAKYFSSNGTVLSLTGLSLAANGLTPLTDEAASLGSTALRWGYVFGSGLKDDGNNIRVGTPGVGNPNTYRGTVANSSTNVAHKFLNTNSLSGSTRIACFYDDNLAASEAFCVDSDGTAVVDGLKVPVVHGAGTAAQAIESGSAAMTAGALAVTFDTAFAAAPKCVCTHVDTTNTNPCTIQAAGAPTTTAVTFAVASGGTDVVNYICIGQR